MSEWSLAPDQPIKKKKAENVKNAVFRENCGVFAKVRTQEFRKSVWGWSEIFITYKKKSMEVVWNTEALVQCAGARKTAGWKLHILDAFLKSSFAFLILGPLKGLPFNTLENYGMASWWPVKFRSNAVFQGLILCVFCLKCMIVYHADAKSTLKSSIFDWVTGQI